MIEVDPSTLSRIVVGVDPSVTSGENADETGIIVAGLGPHQPDSCSTPSCDAHAYILADASEPAAAKNSVNRWVEKVVATYDEWGASLVVIEGNQGQELLEMALRTVRPGIPVKRPNAGESKAARAEPVVALYEQGRVHHVGPPERFAKLEEQMTTWVPPAPGKRGARSPDRLDALVWAVAELNIQGRRGRRRWDDVSPVGMPQANPWAGLGPLL